MQRFEYKVVPAPRRGKKAKGIRGTEAQFANALSELMNEVAAEGWEYLRTDSLPCEERQGLTGRTTVFQNMLVFRRAQQVGDTATPAALPAPDADSRPAPADDSAEPLVAVQPLSANAPEGHSPAIGPPDPRLAETLTRNRADPGVAAE